MNAKAETPAPVLSSIGIDIGKDIFHLVGFDAKGKIILRKKIKRLALADTFKKIPPCIVGMEACLSAHFVSRTLRALGHEPRIIPAIYVKPFMKGQKNDYNDADLSGTRTCTAADQNEQRIVLHTLNKAARTKEDGTRMLLQDAQGDTNIVLVPYAQQTPHQDITSGIGPH